MSENSEASGEEILFSSIARNTLNSQVSNDGLCGSQFLGHTHSPVRDASLEKRMAAEYSIWMIAATTTAPPSPKRLEYTIQAAIRQQELWISHVLQSE